MPSIRLRSFASNLFRRREKSQNVFNYGFSFDGDEANCREGYEDVEGLLAHLDNVRALLEEALKIAEIVRLKVHGQEEELAKLRESLSDFGPQFFALEYGFRN